MATFEVQEDRFGGLALILDPKAHARTDPAAFAVELSAALQRWSSEGKRGIWLRLPTQASHLLDAAVQLGFDFHHAKPGHVMLTKWLPQGPSRLPEYPHHQVGVGGLVLDGRGNVLCVQEQTGLTANMKDFWKLPGGHVDAAEDLGDAAVREVLEETGVRTVFDCIAAIRETHAGPFGCTDLYAVCVLRLDASYGSQVPKPVPQEGEIVAAEWRDLRQFLGSPYYAKGLYGELLRSAAAVALRRQEGGEAATGSSPADTASLTGLERVQMKGLSRKIESFYHANGRGRQVNGRQAKL